MCVKPYNAFLHLFGVTKNILHLLWCNKNILHLLWCNITPTLSLNIHVSYHLIYVSVL